MSILRASAVRGALFGACVLFAACGKGTDYLNLKKGDAAVRNGDMDAGSGDHRDGSASGGGGGGGGGGSGSHGRMDAGGTSYADGAMPPGATMDAAAL